jgi:phosphohistidine phosphatase
MTPVRTTPRKKPATTAARKKPPAPPAVERVVVLVRHGIAEDPTPDKPDADRVLTREGNDRMKENAKGLRELFPRAEAIYSSPLVRAVQTALWISKAYKSKMSVDTTEAMLPEATAGQLRAFVDGLRQSHVILVGHDPSISANLLALAGWTGSFEMKKGGAAALRFSPGGIVTLEWIAPPKVLRKLA